MPGRLQAEIRQSRPFPSLGEEALLNIVRTAEVVQRGLTDFLKAYELSPVQYNVLRILRGAGDTGCTCSEVGERLLTHDPDITRLLDRMEIRSLIVRERSREDRRVVMTRIAPEGLLLVGRIDEPLRDFIRTRLNNFSKDSLGELIGGLERIRDAYQADQTKE